MEVIDCFLFFLNSFSFQKLFEKNVQNLCLLGVKLLRKKKRKHLKENVDIKKKKLLFFKQSKNS